MPPLCSLLYIWRHVVFTQHRSCVTEVNGVYIIPGSFDGEENVLLTISRDADTAERARGITR